MAEIALQNLSAGIQGKVIVANVNLEVKPGEILVLLGPNGAGKSTVMRTIASILKPIEGSVLVDGSDVQTLSARERAKKIAWVPQDESIEFGWTAAEFVGLGRTAANQQLFDSKEDRDRVRECLQKVDAEKFADSSLHRLSGGERQRIRIARGLAQDASVLLLDEPSAHLDIAHQGQVLRLIQDLSAQGITIIVSLHDLNQAIFLRAKYLLISEGRGQVVPDVSELLNGKSLESAFGAEIKRLSHEGEQFAVVPTYQTTDYS